MLICSTGKRYFGPPSQSENEVRNRIQRFQYPNEHSNYPLTQQDTSPKPALNNGLQHATQYPIL